MIKLFSGRLFWFVFIAIYLFFFSALTAYNALEVKENNDLLAYSLYYNCLLNSGYPSCLSEVGSSSEYVFYVITRFLSFYILDYNIFIFFYSFFIYFSVFYLVVSFTKNKSKLAVFVSISFLLTDFRFYDLGNNVLRHGLAVVLMLLFVSLFMSKIRWGRYFYLFFPMLSHVSSIGHLVILIKSRLLDGVLFWLSIMLAGYFFSISIIELALEYFLNFDFVFDKLLYYKQNSSYGNDWLPFHYIVIVLFSLYFTLKNDIYMAVRRILLAYVFLSIVFIPLDMSYRFVSFITPLVAILIAFQVDLVVSKFKNALEVKSLVFVFFMFYLFFIVFKNYTFIVKGF